ncbi:MAG: autoinducer binding domain-containing protein [Burkholderiales bacterium]|nr:autoinducer binding domain-containing protein [Burkholderiales bacterium]MDE2396142.1 autoinducer binding domain-containing protein [Burkholderiales bacterium]
MLPGGFSAVLQATTQDAFRGEVLHFAKRLGFETFAAMLVVDHTLGQSEFFNVHNAPAGFEELGTDPASCRRDPVMQHCKRQSVPIIWDRNTYVSQGSGDLWEEQSRFGYSTGIAMALHLPEGRHFLLGVDRDQPLPNDAGELQRLVADLQLFAVYAQDAAMRLMLPVQHRPERPALTPRELESLRWTMDGKTAWEVGAILGISERTAVLHVNNAMHKLGCINKHQAVLKALRLGLIH